MRLSDKSLFAPREQFIFPFTAPSLENIQSVMHLDVSKISVKRRAFIHRRGPEKIAFFSFLAALGPAFPFKCRFESKIYETWQFVSGERESHIRE